MTTAIVTAYVSANPMSTGQLEVLIDMVKRCLARSTSRNGTNRNASAVMNHILQISHPEPAVPIEESVTEEAIICLECGRGMKMLRQHVRISHGLRAEEYRKKWGLRADYPMVPPKFSNLRKELSRGYWNQLKHKHSAG